MRDVLFLDLCGTLVKENTTFDFFERYILPKKNIFFRFLWRSKLIFCVTFFLRLTPFCLDFTKFVCVYALQGYTRAELNDMALSYVKGLSFSPFLLSKMNQYIVAGYMPVIVSASLDFIVSIVCKELGILNFYSTELLYSTGDVCKGTMHFNLQGKKNIVIERIKCRNSIFITDNFDDANCVDLVNDFFAICTTKEQINYWRSLGVEILYVA